MLSLIFLVFGVFFGKSQRRCLVFLSVNVMPQFTSLLPTNNKSSDLLDKQLHSKSEVLLFAAGSPLCFYILYIVQSVKKSSKQHLPWMCALHMYRKSTEALNICYVLQANIWKPKKVTHLSIRPFNVDHWIPGQPDWGPGFLLAVNQTHFWPPAVVGVVWGSVWSISYENQLIQVWGYVLSQERVDHLLWVQRELLS